MRRLKGIPKQTLVDTAKKEADIKTYVRGIKKAGSGP